jgi:uncharacterized Tic20 family protein
MSDQESGESTPQEVEAEVVSSPPPPPVAKPGASENTMGMLTHLAGLSGFIGIPFGNILGPLLVWVLKKDEMPFVDRCGKEAINFGISMTIYLAVSAVLCLVLIGFVGLVVFGIMALVFPIIAGLKANEGEEYVYPMTIRFIT